MSPGPPEGIGLAIATRFAADGAKVVIGDINEARVSPQSPRWADPSVARNTVCNARDSDQIDTIASGLSSCMTGMILEITGGRPM